VTALRVQVGSILVALAIAGAASAAYPGMGTTRSASSADGKVRYEADGGDNTTISILRGGRRVQSTTLRAPYGFPAPTNQGLGEGVSHDGRTLVLARVSSLGRFAVLDARTLRLRRTISLRGQFTYDALSPRATTLYLIQHVSFGPDDHYYVRAYDLRAGRLLKQIVFDTQEKGEVMRGMAVARATGPSGRWVYTLYGRANRTIFVHALDTVDRHAFCIDLSPRFSQEAQSGLRLTLVGRNLTVMDGQKRVAAIDTKKLRAIR
jgi:hypothetical protein